MENRVKFLNSYIDCIDLETTLKKINEGIKKKRVFYQVSINADKINQMQEDERLRRIINRADIINADGSSVVWAGRLLNLPIKHRVTGIDIFNNLLEISEQEGYRVFFLGATEKSINKMIRVIKNSLPNLQIAGFQNGYYKSDEERIVLDEIKNSDVDILFLGFSSPQKEVWIERNKQYLGIPFIMGVGGSFDILSGKTKRAPQLFQKLGFEWFYRYIQEPKRMHKRYIIGNWKFIKLILKEKRK